MSLTTQGLVEQDIFELVGLAHLSHEEKAELGQLMTETAEQRIAARILEALDDDSAFAWQAKITEEDWAGADQILDKNGLDIDRIALEEILALKARYVEEAAMSEKSQK